MAHSKPSMVIATEMAPGPEATEQEIEAPGTPEIVENPLKDFADNLLGIDGPITDDLLVESFNNRVRLFLEELNDLYDQPIAGISAALNLLNTSCVLVPKTAIEEFYEAVSPYEDDFMNEDMHTIELLKRITSPLPTLRQLVDIYGDLGEDEQAHVWSILSELLLHTKLYNAAQPTRKITLEVMLKVNEQMEGTGDDDEFTPEDAVLSILEQFTDEHGQPSAFAANLLASLEKMSPSELEAMQQGLATGSPAKNLPSSS